MVIVDEWEIEPLAPVTVRAYDPAEPWQDNVEF